jgi:hypothetical protein
MSQPIRPLAIGRPRLSPVKNNTGLYSDLGTPDEFLVAEVQGGQNPDSEMGMYVRLFLAAPEMLELIQSLARTWEDDCRFIPCDTEAASELSNKLARLAAQATQLLGRVDGGEK